MTREDILRMAQEAGVTFVTDFGVASATLEWLERFAALVVAAEREKFTVHAAALVRDARHDATEREREACAKVCESLATDRGMFHPDDEELKIGVLAGAGMCGATIRARGAQ